MPVVFLDTLVGMFVIEAIAVKFLSAETSGAGASQWKLELASMALAIPEAFILAPLLIAVHRYVILGETARGFSIRPARRYLSFVAYAIVFQIAIEAPIAAISVQITDQVAIAAAFVPLALILPVLIAAVIVPLLLISTLTVFPAIAIDAPRAKAWREGIRHYGRLFYTMALASLLALLPVFAIGMGYAVLMEDEILPPPDSLPLTFATISAAASVFFGAVFAAAVSRLYRSFTGIDASG